MTAWPVRDPRDLLEQLRELDGELRGRVLADLFLVMQDPFGDSGYEWPLVDPLKPVLDANLQPRNEWTARLGDGTVMLMYRVDRDLDPPSIVLLQLTLW